MTQDVADFIVEIIERGDASLPGRIANIVSPEMIKHRPNGSAERDRIADVVVERAPPGSLTDEVVEAIKAVQH